jgi:hypothetical protein
MEGDTFSITRRGRTLCPRALLICLRFWIPGWLGSRDGRSADSTFHSHGFLETRRALVGACVDIFPGETGSGVHARNSASPMRCANRGQRPRRATGWRWWSHRPTARRDRSPLQIARLDNAAKLFANLLYWSGVIDIEEHGAEHLRFAASSSERGTRGSRKAAADPFNLSRPFCSSWTASGPSE